MEKLDGLIAKALYYICAFLMFVMAIVINSQVISRYVLGNPFTWSEELGRYTFVWLSFLGMAAAMKHGSHIALDILVTKLNGVNKKVLMIVNNLFVTSFAVILTYSGFKLVELGTRQNSPSLGLPMELVYIVIPISGLILFYYVISGTVQMFQRKEDVV